MGGENDIPGAINCPRCGVLLIPMLGYQEMTIDEALATDGGTKLRHEATRVADFADLPPQIGPIVEDTNAAYVTYISPASLRSSIERHVQDHGETILERSNLKAFDPELFYNLWWYSARFSLPLPLPVSAAQGKDSKQYCAIAAW